MKSFGINEIIEISDGNYVSKISYFLKSFNILSQIKNVNKIINLRLEILRLVRTFMRAM